MSSLRKLLGVCAIIGGGNKIVADPSTGHITMVPVNSGSSSQEEEELPRECLDCQFRYHGVCHGTPEQQRNTCLEMAGTAPKHCFKK